MAKLFVYVMLLLQVLAMCSYVWQGDIRRAAYWLGAVILTAAVTF
jgi:hypothetical protein